VIRVGIRDEDTDFGELSGDRLRDAAMPEVNLEGSVRSGAKPSRALCRG
jgi:hypothetical protein